MRIDQLLPSFAKHDAIGNHTLNLREALRSVGYESDIYAESIDARMAKEAKSYRSCPNGGLDQVLLYHASTNAGGMYPWMKERSRSGQPLLAYYHNITPAEYFERWLPEATPGMREARKQLVDLAGDMPLAMAASEYSRLELVDAGYKRAVESPLLLDLEDLHGEPDRKLLAVLEREQESTGSRWIFVGRIAPNKCQHDVIAAFATYRRLYDQRAALTLVGGATAPLYLRALQGLCQKLDLGDSVRFLDGVPFRDLSAHMCVSDVFVCLSEHEGFCVPLIESMEMGVPVVAYAAAAVPETVAEAGVILGDKDPLTVAVEVDSLMSDPVRREALVAAGRKRAERFSLNKTSEELIGHLSRWLEERG